jgi:hypothetical protein
LAAFCKKWLVCEFSLFGSILRDDFGPESDVDVLVRFAQDAPWDMWDLIAMRDELAELVERPVDLIEYEALRNPYRKREILRTREVVYAA